MGVDDQSWFEVVEPGDYSIRIHSSCIVMLALKGEESSFIAGGGRSVFSGHPPADKGADGDTGDGECLGEFFGQRGAADSWAAADDDGEAIGLLKLRIRWCCFSFCHTSAGVFYSPEREM